ncbi:GH92 family glycosyl hydrolase [Edaphobacter dinghuensis]|uniref:Alpha-1 2-mannosidase n=1 Tax=Edaphobacter dinghuensis TaxID=1560005 RepID=A0A917LW75_9BACT|nr:GH92 family glycosyl hydrolase [Edaphobacter dinghuensis]GGG62872.1 alpha-1 2-mannosidase [Edaphobacter dinghuensis]
MALLQKRAFFLLVLLSGIACAQPSHAITDPYGLVDPRIGTAHDGQTYPVVGMPFGMTGWTPETQPTEAKCLSPYYYKESKLTGFRGSHWLSGSCTQDYGSVSLMPIVGELKVLPEARASRFSHSSETMSPAFYSVFLEDYRTKVELTGTTHAGMLRITFPATGARHLVVQPNARLGQGFIEVRPQQHEIVGYNPVVRIYQGAGESAGFSGYFAVRFRENVAHFGTWCGDVISANRGTQGSGCSHLGGFVTFDKDAPSQVLVKVGTSFTSIEEAEKNLDAEESGWNFNNVRIGTERSWRQLLQRIEIEGGTPAEQTIFYTALFHASLAPRVISDADGTYNGFAQQNRMHRAAPGTAYYDDFSLWDTFRALHPLLTILQPDRDQQMVQSLIDKGEQGGFLPIFPTWNSYTSEMIGDHAVAVIYDAYAKGLRNFDVDSAYRLVRQNALVTPPHDQYVAGKGRRALDSYSRYGYIPLEDKVLDAFHHNEQVSRTLEYAYDDYVVSQFAADLGHTADAKLFLERSGNWHNVFDSSVGFVRGRHADGQWVTPFDPAKPETFITEGVPWQYTFFVPQDVKGLIAASGGSDKFIAKLDGLFANNLYDQGNEPSHGIAYLYNKAGAPWKTQQHVRDILLTQFGPEPSGLPGNDDAGQMSAWYVLSAMGFYQECPGTPTYSIGSPLFTRVVIHQENGKSFTIMARGNSSQNIFVRSVTLNGRPLPQLQFSHHDIVSGATLVLQMEAKPYFGNQGAQGNKN